VKKTNAQNHKNFQFMLALLSFIDVFQCFWAEVQRQSVDCTRVPTLVVCEGSQRVHFTV